MSDLSRTPSWSRVVAAQEKLQESREAGDQAAMHAAQKEMTEAYRASQQELANGQLAAPAPTPAPEPEPPTPEPPAPEPPVVERDTKPETPVAKGKRKKAKKKLT